jgi:phenylacetate-CoA ligase
VHGRSDRCIILGGSNLTEPILDEALRTNLLEHILTGQYRAQIVYRGDQQFLALRVERKPGVGIDAAAEQFVYNTLIETIGRLQPEFRGDWETVYRHSDSDPSRRILQIEWCDWPELSHADANVAKQVSVRQPRPEGRV